MIRSKRERLLLVLAALCALAGCNREPGVVQTSQPKEAATAAAAPAPTTMPLPAGHPAVQPGAATPGMDQAAALPELAWSAPAGWREDKTPRMMREATFQVGAGDKAAEIVVTRLGAQFGDMVSNINRWRAQVGLEAVTDIATTVSRDVKSPAGDVKVYTMDGPAQSMMVGILKQGESNWFFKMVGDKATVTQNGPAFDQFLQSVRNVTAGDK